MNALKYLMMASIVLSNMACSAQQKNQKSETVKIYGNCGMCEATIEKAGNMKDLSTIDWDKDSKMAVISYDSLKTSKEDILKRIALAGYDSDLFLAPDDTYSNLPDCCQYERAKASTPQETELDMDMDTNDHSMHANAMTQTQDSNLLLAVYEHYFAVKDALVKTDGATAATHAKALATAIDDVKMDKLPMDVHLVWMELLENLKVKTKQIADTKDAGRQRAYFMTLSTNMYTLMKVSKPESTTYYQFCPMANDGKGANWLSKENAVKNPYYGSQMLTCGKTVETLD